MWHCNAPFEIDDSAITERGFTCHSTYPAKFTGNTLILTNMDTLFVKVYSNNQTGDYFAVGFGQLFTTDWIHVESGGSSLWDSDWKEYAEMEYYKMLARALEHASSMYEVYSHHRVCIMQTCLHQLTLRTVVYKSSTQNGVKLEVFRDPSFDYVSGEWIGFHVSVGRIFPRSAYYFHVSIDITHRKETRRIATLHSTLMIVRSLSVVSMTQNLHI